MTQIDRNKRRDASEARFVRDLAASNLVAPGSSGGCRLLVKILIEYGGGLVGWLLRLLLPWGGWVMMRRQLLNFKELSERTALRAAKRAGG